MTKKGKKKLYTRALYVIVGLLVIPAILSLAGCTKSSPRELSQASIPAKTVETADTKIRREIRIDEMWAEAKELLRRSDTRTNEAPSAARSMALGASSIHRQLLVEAIERESSF